MTVSGTRSPFSARTVSALQGLLPTYDLLTYIRLGGQPQLGPVPHLRPQHVAAADVQKPEVSHNPVAEK